MTISNSVVYTDEERAHVQTFLSLKPDQKIGTYWERDDLAPLRSKVKAHYIREQKFRCCYCNRHLGSDNHRLWDVEHIASRSEYPHFMFEPLNLAASCVDCNNRKREKDPLVRKSSLVNTRRRTYPTKSDDFRIVHPHLDKFDDHIAVSKWVYVGKTAKGRETIYACDLLRFAQMFIEWENSASNRSFEKEVDALFQRGARSNSPSAFHKIFRKLYSYIEKR